MPNLPKNGMPETGMPETDVETPDTELQKALEKFDRIEVEIAQTLYEYFTLKLPHHHAIYVPYGKYLVTVHLSHPSRQAYIGYIRDFETFDRLTLPCPSLYEVSEIVREAIDTLARQETELAMARNCRASLQLSYLKASLQREKGR